MGKVKMDLSIASNAEISKNNTAMTGVFIMNLVLAIAYLLEVVKGARSMGSYAVVAAFVSYRRFWAWLFMQKIRNRVSYVIFWELGFLYYMVTSYLPVQRIWCSVM